MRNLEKGTRVLVTDKNGKQVKTWFGVIKKIHGNVNPPDDSKDGDGYSILPESTEFVTMKVRHHTSVKKA